MSNRAYIYQEIKIVVRNGRISRRISVCDDSRYQVINLGEETEFFTDKLEILRFVLYSILDSCFYEINEIFNEIIECKTGIYVEDNWFTWEQIEPIFKEFNMLED